METALATTVGFGLAWIGPFDTDRQPLIPRTAFWTAISVCWFLLLGLCTITLNNAPRFRAWPAGWRSAVVLLAASVPMLPLAGLAIQALEGGHLGVTRLAGLYAKVLLLGAGLSFFHRSVVAQLTSGLQPSATPHAVSPARATVPEHPALCRLAARLPPADRGRICCLSMEDHYVRVHTEAGSQLLLMRFSDAIAELDGLPGLRVHRSWWIAEGVADALDRSGRTAAFRVGHITVPVSRPYLKAAKALPLKAGAVHRTQDRSGA